MSKRLSPRFDSSLYFVADIGANHDGDLGRAFRLIELAKEAGADAAKFQHFQAPKIVSKHGFELLQGATSHQSEWKKSVYDVYEDASLSQDWTAKLKEACEQYQIDFFTSPYDFQSVDHVDPFVDFYKIGSGDITWTRFIEYVASKNKPIMLATGAADFEDVKRAANAVLETGCDLVLMQCNTNYTVDVDKHRYVNLNVLRTYAEHFPGVVLGLSDHTLGYATVCGAVALGATVIEKHFTDDNEREGPDHRFAMNPENWRIMVDTANEVFEARGDGVKRVEANEIESRIVQQRSLWAVRELRAGEVISENDFEALRPCPNDAVRPHELIGFVGKRLIRTLSSGDCLSYGDVETKEMSSP